MTQSGVACVGAQYQLDAHGETADMRYEDAHGNIESAGLADPTMLVGGLEEEEGALAAKGLKEGVEAVAKDIEISFGHGARHLAGTGLDAQAVESTIRNQVSADVRGASETGAFWGRVKVGTTQIEYRGYTVAKGRINIGTYYPLP